ncbi:MAG: type II toxin-antitoxin system HicB family antitoxin [Planctomycetes bacterium]|nr:type II toxin-antitoxin system HicB family antitoxin [Planctomycetota bacterium]
MLLEYVQEALERARYELIKDEEPYYGEVPELPGVWATGKTLEECRSNLREVIEGWIIIRLQQGLSVPRLGRRRLDKAKRAVAHV